MMKKDKKELLKKILKYSLVAIVIVFLVGIISNTSVFADVGNNNRYEDSGSSSGGDGSGAVGWLIYILFELFGPIPGLIILIVIGIVVWQLKKKGKLGNIVNQIQNTVNSSAGNVTQGIGINNTQNVAAQIRQIDPNFSEDKFIGWAREVFVKIQQYCVLNI